MKRTGKRIASLCAVLVLLTAAFGTGALAQQEVLGYVSAEQMSVYRDAALSRFWGNVPRGTIVHVTGRSGSVAQVMLNGRTGYARLSDMRQLDPGATVYTTQKTRAYQYPSLKAKSASVDAAQAITLLAVHGDCAQVRSSIGVVGYMYLYHLSMVLPQMTESEAIARVRAVDSDAGLAKRWWVNVDSGTGSAWVFYDVSGQPVSFSGRYWYVNRSRCVRLGQARNTFGTLLQRAEPSVYSCEYGQGTARRVAAFIERGGMPVPLNLKAPFTGLYEGANGTFYGVLGDDEDYVFLTLANGTVCERAAAVITPGQFRMMNGADAILAELSALGWSAEQCLYRNGANVVLNLKNGSTAGHLYMYYEDGALRADRGWNQELLIHGGSASVSRNVGLPVVASEFGK